MVWAIWPVCWTANGVSFDDAMRQRGTGMGTLVGQREEAATDVEDADYRFTDRKHP